MFMSGKLVFPNDIKEYHFGYEDLRDLGEIGRGRYGRVNKMMHIDTGRLLAVKVIFLDFAVNALITYNLCFDRYLKS